MTISTYIKDRHASIRISAMQDAGLSWKATGILCYLLSKPHGWITRMGDLIHKHTDGEKSVQSGVKELEQAGYLYRFEVRVNGKIDWRSIVTDEPLSKDEWADVANEFIQELQEKTPELLPEKTKCKSTVPPLRRRGSRGAVTATYSSNTINRGEATENEDLKTEKVRDSALPNGDAPPSKQPEKGMKCIAGNPAMASKVLTIARPVGERVSIGEWCAVSGDHPGFQVAGLFLASNGAVWATDSKGQAYCLVSAAGEPFPLAKAV